MAQIFERRAQLLANIPAWYSGRIHFLFVHTTGLAAIGLCLGLLEAPSWSELALVPAFFVFANFFEWWVHRGPLHHPTRGLTILHERHAKAHHVVFAGARMEIENPNELIFVLFPPYVLPLLLLLNAPIAAGLWFLRPNLAWLFLASGIAYYLVYELLHLFHHLPRESWIGRRSVVRALRRHHWRHHEPPRMTEGNFNVSFPLADWVLGSTLPPTVDPPERRGDVRG